MNKKEFDFLGITRWHELGYKGKGVTVCSKEEIIEGVFEDVFGLSFETSKDKYSTHATQVMDYIRQVAPEATKWAISTKGMIDIKDIFHSERCDYLLEHTPDIITTSYFSSWDKKPQLLEIYNKLKAQGAYLVLASR